MATSESNITQQELNRKYLSERFPERSELLHNIESKYSYVYDDLGLYFQLRSNERYLTRQPDLEYSQMRIQGFIDQPPRLSMVSKAYEADSVKSTWNAALSSIALPDDDPRWSDWAAMNESEGLICFDVGNLDVMAELIKTKMPELKGILFCIRDLDYFFAQLEFQDWSRFFSLIDERNIMVNLRFIKDDSDVISALRGFIWKHYLFFPDNILCYFHFAGIEQKNLWRKIRYEYLSLVSGLGFFDDELGMFDHTFKNLIENEGVLIDLVKQDRPFGRCIVVGSGPSLDKCIKDTPQIFNNAFVIAAGTGVEPLLKANIPVDVCVILERGKDLVEFYSEMSNRVDLSSVKLVGSSTTAPGLREFFGDAIYFIRPGLNVFSGFSATEQNTLFGCDPTVSNTALALAIELGFSQCVLVGVDMGSCDPELHHSTNTAYYVSDDKAPPNRPFKVPAQAQLGGAARTTQVLHWARQSLNGLLARGKSKGVQVISLSDGVELENVVPLPWFIGDTLDQAFPSENQRIPDLSDFVSTFDVGRMNYSETEWNELIKKIHEILDYFSWNDRFKVGEELFNLLWKPTNSDPLVMFIRGSFYLLLWHAFSILSRMKSDDRLEAELVVKQGLIDVINYMNTTVCQKVFLRLDENA